MTEAERIEIVLDLHADPLRTSPETLSAAQAAVTAFPHSARLWFLHAEVMMAAEGEHAGALAAQSYERCLQLDPNCAEAHEALGHYFDGILEEPQWALEHYALARAIRERVPHV